MRTMRVGVRDRQNLWILVLHLLTGVRGDEEWEVNYPDEFCAIEGSTVTIPCNYKYPKDYTPVRVSWCINHEICQDFTPKFYDSNSTKNHPGFKYIGDKKKNCTLQIENINKSDSTTYRFRFETYPKNALTGTSGVVVKVKEIDKDSRIQLEVKASDDGASKQRVTLSCITSISSPCIFNNMKITWYQNNRILRTTGPTLTLSRVSPSDAGNYSCGIERRPLSRSDAYSLQEEEPSNPSIVPIVVPVLLFVLIITVAAAILLIRRRKAEDQKKENKDGVSTLPVHARYSSDRKKTLQTTGKTRHENIPQAEEEVNYATIDFQSIDLSRPANIKQQEDHVIYNTVVPSDEHLRMYHSAKPCHLQPCNSAYALLEHCT